MGSGERAEVRVERRKMIGMEKPAERMNRIRKINSKAFLGG